MTYEEINNFLLQIKNETTHGGNTRVRVYQALKEILDFAQEVGQSSSASSLSELIGRLQQAFETHTTSGTSHEALFTEVKNIIDEKIADIEVGGGDVDVTNLLHLRNMSGELLVLPSDVNISEANEEVVISGNGGGNVLFAGVPSILPAGKYTLSFVNSDLSAAAADVLTLVKLGGTTIDMPAVNDGGKVTASVTLTESTSVMGIRYQLTNSRKDMVLSRICLTKGEYSGYTLPVEDYVAGVRGKVPINLTELSLANVADITTDQLIYLWDGVSGKRISLKELAGVITFKERVKRVPATPKDLKQRVFSVEPKAFRTGSAVVYLNGQALFEELGDFITLDQSTVKLTKENINDPTDTDKVVVEALFIDK